MRARERGGEGERGKDKQQQSTCNKHNSHIHTLVHRQVESKYVRVREGVIRGKTTVRKC